MSLASIHGSAASPIKLTSHRTHESTHDEGLHKPPLTVYWLVQPAMLLLQLPAEILILIFEYVGSFNFRADLSRLLVCKQWSQLAISAYVSDIHITQGLLQRLSSSPDKKRIVSLLQENVKSLNLDLVGFKDWKLIDPPPGTRFLSYQDDEIRLALREASSIDLAHNLVSLSTILIPVHNRLALRIHASREIHPGLSTGHVLGPAFGRREYLSQSAVRTLLSACSLTSLELDLHGTRFIPGECQQDGGALHFCSFIAGILPSLERLRLRMDMICSQVLVPPDSSPDKLRLKKYIINLCVKENLCGRSSSCEYLETGLHGRDSILKTCASNLARRMETPKMMRIIMWDLDKVGHHDLEIEGIQHRYGHGRLAYDVLTDKHILVEKGDPEWDEPGRVLDDDEVSYLEREIYDRP